MKPDMCPLSPLDPRSLSRASSPSAFAFTSTAEVTPLAEPIGQARAMEAARFALSVRRPGYNLAAVGPHGVGKHRSLMALLERLGAEQPAGPDACYVYDFADEHHPVHLQLPSGRGRFLVEDLDRLVEDLKASIPAALEGDEHRARVQEIQEELNEHADRVFERAEARAEAVGIKMVRTPSGVVFLPTVGGEVIGPEAFEQLAEEDRNKTTQTIETLQKQLQHDLRQVPRWAKEARDKLRDLKREVSRYAVAHSIEELEKRWSDVPAVLEYLHALADDVVDNADAFRASEDEPERSVLGDGDPFKRYRVNLLVDNAGRDAAPVVYEDKPSVDHLVGRIDHRVHLGNLVTDFTLIRAGSLLAANGGFLVLDAAKVLSQTYAWQALKRALFAREVRIESLARMLGLSGGDAIEPQPIPLDVKVVLVMDRRLHMLLTLLDSEMADLFKVTAEFDDQLDRDAASERDFAGMLAALSQLHELRPLDNTAVARLVEHSARMAGDASKLSTDVRRIGDLLVEADHVAGTQKRATVTAGDVQAAIDQQIRRDERVRERIHELIAERTIMVDTAGERVGQINGLWVRMLGDFAFGAPTRITATVRVGRGEIVDIEREANLGGSLHSKGVLILGNYFAARFARSTPPSLHASLVFEQSYAGVEGDSASLAELCCLLSALSGLPIKQSFAITGSVDQHGNAQPIGGVNEKIEGFFDVCRRRGLDGQAVIIPRQNVKNLMLRADVVEACRQGRFHVYAVEHADQAIELLTGVEAGAPDERGELPAASVNGRAQAQLEKFASAAQKFVLRATQARS